VSKSFLCSFLLVLLLNSGPLFAETPTSSRLSLDWYSLLPSDDRLSEEIETNLQSYAETLNFSPRIQRTTVGNLKTDLQSADKKLPVLIHCTLAEYRKMQNDPELDEILSDLHVELLNPRIISLPLYLIISSNDALRNNPAQIGFITLPSSDLYAIEEADLLTMLSQILSRPKASIKTYRERDAYTAAKRMFDGTYQMVGVYEDEPSMLLNEFFINLQQELKTAPPHFLSIDPEKVNGLINVVAPDRLSYVFFRYVGQPFTESQTLGKTAVLAVVQQPHADFPLILTNLRTIAKDSVAPLLKALSHSYFLAVPAISSRQQQEKQIIERDYLLNAYLLDPEDRFKSLALLGHLLLMRSSAHSSAEREIYEEKCELLLRKTRIGKISAQRLFEWLGIALPKIDRRELFTDDVSKLYENALSDIGAASGRTMPERKKLLEDARTNLIAAMLKAEEPRNVTGARGLWSTTDYNPYYQLGRVTLLLQQGEK
jgi:hypothetical protein